MHLDKEGEYMIDLTGQRFGSWTVLERGPDYVYPSGKRRATRWRCECICGATVLVVSAILRNGGSTQCRDCANRTHGMSYDPEYSVWNNMLLRCYNPSNHNYPYYGARGITVCERWHSFELWMTDILVEIGPRPKGKTLDRVNNDGNYEPGNIRWATRKEQAQNRRKQGSSLSTPH
jgi:hypothetical protein